MQIDKDEAISVVLLAGGKGMRMGLSTPKQFLPLQGKPLVFYSLELFLKMEEVTEIVVVCDKSYRPLFAPYAVKFADPGTRRQDSLFNGLQEVSPTSKWICVHDAARPLITHEMVQTLFQEGRIHGAACLGMPVKWSVKARTKDNFVQQTIDRDYLWEIQTPQFLSKELLMQGFALAQEKNLTVTDDVSLAEHLGHPVKLVKGAYSNIKITTPEDLTLAHQLL